MKAVRRLVLIVSGLALVVACGEHTLTAPQPPALRPQAASADLLGTLLGGLLSCSNLPYDSTTQTIGIAGGVLSVGHHTLVIPPGAVAQPTAQSIESTDSYTFGHCERVAQHAMAVARVLTLDETSQTTIRLGAYLHDLGKVRVPHEILNKPGPLTRDEFEVVQMHPIWGLELLAAVEFPWDLKPIIRWHHERYDGTGYPDRLRGDEIPIAAQIVGIVDMYDALTTARPYRPALSRQTAVTEIEKCRGWWSAAVYAAFAQSLEALPSPPGAVPPRNRASRRSACRLRDLPGGRLAAARR